MPQQHIGLTLDSARRLSAVVRGAERLGIHVPPPGRTNYRDDYPVPVHVGKATAAIAAGGSGNAAVWSSTFASTAAETAVGSTETVYSWGGQSAANGDELAIFRSYRNGRLYFINLLPPKTYCWFAQGNNGIDESGSTRVALGTTDVILRFDDLHLPSTSSTDVGVAIDTSNNHTQVNFTKSGWYKIEFTGEMQLQSLTASTFEHTMTGRYSILRSTDKSSTSATWAAISGHSDARLSITRTPSASGGGDTPEQRCPIIGLINATSNHAIRFEADLVSAGSSLWELALTRHTLTITNVDNSESYATS